MIKNYALKHFTSWHIILSYWVLLIEVFYLFWLILERVLQSMKYFVPSLSSNSQRSARETSPRRPLNSKAQIRLCFSFVLRVLK